MSGSFGPPRTLLALVATSVLLALGACGADGAGADGDSPGATQNAPASTAPGAVAVTVSGAVPVSGNAQVAGSGAVSVAAANGLRAVDASGQGNGLLHRFGVTYDPLSGAVIAVVHAWGRPESASPDAVTGCVRAVTAPGQVACGTAVSVDTAAARVRFAGAVLRGDGSFASILNGDIAFTPR
jgi:hypothetical protein